MDDSRQSTPTGQSKTDALRELSTLADPARQSLYKAVSASDEPITRDAAATAAGISRTLAAYHLDLLVDAGLLGTTFARRDGAGGPGAGRPAKHYYRIQQERNVSVPPRNYELLADLLATAFNGDSDGVVHSALLQAADVEGRRFGAERPRQPAVPDPDASDGSTEEAEQGESDQGQLCELLEERGYEPMLESDGSIGLRNCPFHRLSRSHTDLVCGLNHALLSGVLEGRGDDSARAELCPREGRCCVVIRPES